MRRTLVWINEPRFAGWGCSECAWVFNPSGPPRGDSLEDMTRNYEQQRSRDFAAHVCATHRKSKDSGPGT
jgi:rubredoxin